MRIAFYAPMKAPDHPTPSGDRTMARALLKTLGAAGHKLAQPSGLRSFIATPDRERQDDIAKEAAREVDRITERWSVSGVPDLWFTYHNHHKAPDLLGPSLADRLGLPYVLAEASYAAKRAGEWGIWHRAAEAAIRAADLHVCFTARDRSGIEPLRKPGGAILTLPPFLDLDGFDARSRNETGDTPRLVTVAMMRGGDKLQSYGLLADALALCLDRPWRLDVVGDGPARDAVHACFTVLPPDRVTWHGMVEPTSTWDTIQGADLFVWPGFGEAFGLAYLEAQAWGIPVLALDTAGVSTVVLNGVTGLLVPIPSAAAYANALRYLIDDRAARRLMSEAARRFVREERSLAVASATLGDALQDAFGREAANRE